MELIIGGYAQGKLHMTKERFPMARVISPEEYYAFAEEEESQDVVILNAVHQLIKKELPLRTMEEIKGDLLACVSRHPNLVIISDEVGNGVVPMKQQDRQWREACGRILIALAAEATSVERVICGIPQKIK